MIFSSPVFVFLFLPAVFLGYFCVIKTSKSHLAAKLLLVTASFFFYGYWKLAYLPILLGSICVNYYIAKLLVHRIGRPRRHLVTGLAFNLGLLGYFKYYDFFLTNTSTILGLENPPLLELLLPLGISFFTFQQIAYLVDCYSGKASQQNLLDYSLFVSFFPQLIAGPIVHHQEMAPQFENARNREIQWDNVSLGVFIFTMGLFKKTVIADAFADWANIGFAQNSELSFFDSWGVALSYTFQLYFDFSGYSDMAVGAARLFNIHLPINFNSPYKATSIQDFWRRWHITLSRWLRDYIYIPLGGNQRGKTRVYLNLFITFLLGGLWHGAGWTFVVWGAMHGAALCVHRFWRLYTGIALPKAIGVALTFLFVTFAWVVFRAETFSQAMNVWAGMVGAHGSILPENVVALFSWFTGNAEFTLLAAEEMLLEAKAFGYIAVFSIMAFVFPNSMELSGQIHSKHSKFTFAPTFRYAFFTSILFFLSMLTFIRDDYAPTKFLYFNF